MKNKTLMTDFYELTMAQTYFDSGCKDELMYFDIFYRRNPFDGGYAVSGGLDNIIEYINNFHFDDDMIAYLKSLNKFSDEFLNYLRGLKFTGSIYAVYDGTPIFPNEPVIRVEANAIEAQILETALLTYFNHGTLVTTAARRIVNEAKKENGEQIPVMEFGARRARGLESAIDASKYAIVGGCVGTSNTLAGFLYDIPVMGTTAHSQVTHGNSEYESFLEYAKSNPTNTTFLVDTYDTLRSGVVNAIKVADDYLTPNGYPFNGIRIDSGDLAYLSKKAREMLDNAGYKNTKICLSNGLNEYTIRDLISQGACFDSLGVGDNISASKERVGGVYKLVAIKNDNEIIPKIKVSDDRFKTTTPGIKKLYRFYDKDTNYALGDLVALSNEIIGGEKYILRSEEEPWKKTLLKNYYVKELLKPIYINGKQVYESPSVMERKKYSEEEMKSLYPEVTRLTNPHKYYVDLSEELYDLKYNMIEETQKIKRLKR